MAHKSSPHLPSPHTNQSSDSTSSPIQSDTKFSMTSVLQVLSENPPPSPDILADSLDTARKILSAPHPDFDAILLSTLTSTVLKANPANLLLAHRAVAVLAHPALCGFCGPNVERPVIDAMDRLSMSAAFIHTAMAALQNAAGADTTITKTLGIPQLTSNINQNQQSQQISQPNQSPSTDRDAVVLAVVSAMRQHHTQNGILLRGADLIAFHLNQDISAPLTSSFRLASRIIVDVIDKLSATPQGASTAILALVATVRHISSNATFVGRPSSTTRFSRGSTTSTIVDSHFARAVVLTMARHRKHVSVQVLGCEVIRISSAGGTTLARIAAKELYTAGAATAVVASLHTYPSDASIVNAGIVALRSLLLGGGFHGRSTKPSLHIDDDVVDTVSRAADRVAESISAKDRDLSSAATVLAIDIRSAVTVSGVTGTSTREQRTTREKSADTSNRLSGFRKRIMRRIRFGNKHNFYESEYNRHPDDGLNDAEQSRPVKDFSQMRGRRVSGRTSFSIAQAAGFHRRSSGTGNGFQHDNGGNHPKGRTSGINEENFGHGGYGFTGRNSTAGGGGMMGGGSSGKGRGLGLGLGNMRVGGRPTATQDLKERGGPSPNGGFTKETGKISDISGSPGGNDNTQIPLNRRWRSVSGRWNRNGRRGSIFSNSIDVGEIPGRGGVAAAAAALTNQSVLSKQPSTSLGMHADRRGPLTLSGSDVANLTRQPSRIFTTSVDVDPTKRRRDLRYWDARTASIAEGHDDIGF